VIDLSLSSDEKNFIADTSRDAKFTRKLSGDLNRGILRPPGDGKVIILDDSDKEKEAPDEKMVDPELTATSATVNPTPNASAIADDTPEGAKTIIVMIRRPIRRPVATTAMEVVMVRLRPPRRRPRC
jgi:hypothetical protein